MKIRYIIILLLFLANLHNLYQQNSVCAVKRKVEKEFEFDVKSESIVVNAEKAQISIKSWNKSQVKVVLFLVVKHYDESVAKKEINYLKYNLSKSKNELYLNNYTLLKSDAVKLESRVSAVYKLWIPNNSKIKIQNKFGLVSINDINVNLEIDVDYCDIKIENVTGNIEALVNIGDIVFSNSNLMSDIVTKYSEINMENISGKYVFNTTYGRLSIIPKRQLSSLKIDSKNTDIIFVNRSCLDYNLSLTGTYSNINFSKSCYIHDSKYFEVNKINEEYKDKKELNYWISEDTPFIKINSRFGTISLN